MVEKDLISKDYLTKKDWNYDKRKRVIVSTMKMVIKKKRTAERKNRNDAAVNVSVIITTTMKIK